MTLRASLVLTARADQFKSELRQAGAVMRDLGTDAKSAGNTVAASFSAGLSGLTTRITSTFSTIKEKMAAGGGSARFAIANVGNQLQDAFGQLSAGTPWVTVLSQQLPQALQSLGPIGIAAGAGVAAVGLALKGLPDSAAEAEQAISGIGGAIREVNDLVGDSSNSVAKAIAHYDKLGSVTQKLGAAKAALDQRDLNRELEGGARALAATVAAVERLTSVSGPIAERTGRAALAPGVADDVRRVVEAFRASGDEAALVTQLEGLSERGGEALTELARRASDLANAMDEARRKIDQAGSIRSSLQDMASGGTEAMGQLEEGLKAVQEAVGATTQSFADMYQDVVGGSYIPDMVEESATWFDKLKADLTGKTKDATGEVANAFRGLTRQVSGELSSMIVHNKLALTDFADFVQSTVQTVLQGLIQVGLNAGFSYAFAPSGGGTISGGGGGDLSGSVGADTLHGGGIAGAPGNRKTVAPLSLFSSARRYHAGGPVLRAGEVPAILQAGETVSPRGAGAGGTQIVNVIDQRQGGEKVETRQRRGAGGEQIVDVLIRDRLAGGLANGTYDTAMRTRYGLSPVTGTR